jgi:U4/U6 small nuclear ribonucleoprotein PRP31
LAARVDSYKNHPDGTEGSRLRAEVEEKLEALEAPSKARTKKALPIPEEKRRSKRGGKRVRRYKERFAMTEIRKQQNQMGFCSTLDEYGDSAMGFDKGMIGAKDTGRLRVTQEKKVKLPVKKQKAVSAGSSGQTNGLSSTLVFNDVQGIELAPNAINKVAAANAKWFSASSGFLSAAPSARPNNIGGGMVLK